MNVDVSIKFEGEMECAEEKMQRRTAGKKGRNKIEILDGGDIEEQGKGKRWQFLYLKAVLKYS